MNNSKQCIYEALLDAILKGAIKPGGKLPTETELAEKFNTSRMSAHYAIKLLEEKGLVKSNKKGGRFLLKKPDTGCARELEGKFSRRVNVIASPKKSRNIFHWNETTLYEMEKHFAENGFSMSQSELPLNAGTKELEKLLEKISKGGSAALVLIPEQEEMNLYFENIELLYRYQWNIYVFNRSGAVFSGFPFHMLSLDPFSEGIMAVEYLYGKGFRKIISWKTDTMDTSSWVSERLRGLQAGLCRASKSSLEPEIMNIHEPKNLELICKKIKSSRIYPAFAALNDAYAASLIDCAGKYNLRAPDDFSVISFDNNPEFRTYNLTTVAPPLEKLGKSFVQFVCLNSFPKEEGNILNIKISSGIIERETCRK
ncbi:MAG: hypothetical protein A2017_10110 [Lentisphaerae bacterium GWF2_44_16]|nr:MAG: hypothetical protein A2017_10110 [Lentisphaerae bacterium GWF2_44_16]